MPLLLLLILCLHLNPGTTAAQNQLRQTQDSLHLPEEVILLNPDHSWSRIYTREGLEADKKIIDTSAIFRKNWDRREKIQTIPPLKKSEKKEILLTSDSRLFSQPAKGKIALSFAKTKGGLSGSIGIKTGPGSAVFSTFDGKVRHAEYHPDELGNVIIIRHYNGIETWYANLSEIHVLPDEMVKSGQLIGKAGVQNSPELYFGCRYSEAAFNPEEWLMPDNLRIKTHVLTLTENSFLPVNETPSPAANEVKAIQDKSISVNDSVKSPEKPKEQILPKSPKKESKPANQYHKIKSGDTLYGIALKYKVGVGQICKLNNIKKDEVLRLGQTLRIK